MRRCIGCYNSFQQDELVRFTLQNGSFVADRPKQAVAMQNITTSQGNDGRGYYLCRNTECLDRALKRKAFNRIAQRSVDPEELKDVIDAIQ